MILEKEYQRQNRLLTLLNEKKNCSIKELSTNLNLCTKTTILELTALESKLKKYQGNILIQRKDNTIELVRNPSFNIEKVRSQFKRATLYFRMVNFYLDGKGTGFNLFLKSEFHSYSYGYKYRTHLKGVLSSYNLTINNTLVGDEWDIRLFMLDFYRSMYLGEAYFFEDNDKVAEYLQKIEKIEGKDFSYQENYDFRQILYIVQKRIRLRPVIDFSKEWETILRETERFDQFYKINQKLLVDIFQESNKNEILFLMTIIYSIFPPKKIKNAQKLLCISGYFQQASLFLKYFQEAFFLSNFNSDEFIYQLIELLAEHSFSLPRQLKRFSDSDQEPNNSPKNFEMKFSEVFDSFMLEQQYSIEEENKLYPVFLKLARKQFSLEKYYKKIEICLVTKGEQEEELIMDQMNNWNYNLLFVKKITSQTEIVISTGILVDNKNICYCSAPLLEGEINYLKEEIKKFN